MKNNLIGLCLLLFVSTFTFAQNEAAEKVVAQVSSKKFEWMTQKNWDSLATVLDERLHYVHSNGWVQSKKEVLDDFRSQKLILRQVTEEKTEVRMYDHTAVLNGSGKFMGALNGNAFELHLMYTEVYVQQAGTWKLVSRHANKLEK